MAVAQTKVATLEQVLPTLLDPSQGMELSKPLAFVLPCPRGWSSPAALMAVTNSGKSSPEAQGFLRKERASAVDDDPQESHVQPRRLRPVWGQGGRHPGQRGMNLKGIWGHLGAGASLSGQGARWHICVCLSVSGLCPAAWPRQPRRCGSEAAGAGSPGSECTPVTEAGCFQHLW